MINKDIELINVSKYIDGQLILNNINLSINSGEICGLYGRNGSGKSMLLKIICGLVVASSGTVIVSGETIGLNERLPKSMGMLIEHPGLLTRYSGYKNLKILSEIKRIAGDENIREAITEVGLSATDKRPVRKYSLGMRQKLAIAQAVFESPQILLLDEPTNNLDEESSFDLFTYLKTLNLKQSTTMLIVSHQKAQLCDLCKRIFVMKNGTLIDESGVIND